MKIYLSGKISGLTEAEYKQNFKAAYSKLFELKIVDCSLYVVNPLDIKPLFGIKRWVFFMVADLWQLRKCSHIAIQKNWIYSRGAMIEVYCAKFIFKQEIIWL